MGLAGFNLKQSLAGLSEPALRNVEYFERRLRAFGIVAVVGFPLYYYVWHELFPQPYENLGLRLVGAALFVPIFLGQYWPAGAKKYLAHYWYVSLLYALPFFFTFMLLKNNASSVWVESTLVAVFVMILLLDWLTLVAHFILGIGLASLAYALTTDGPLLAFTHFEYLTIIFFAVVIGVISNYDSERIRIEQERAMLATAGSIAHELRTPLLGIRAGAAGLAKYLPTLLESYDLARQNGLPVPFVRAAHLDAMKGVLDRIEMEAGQSNAVIDMLLVNARLASAGDYRPAPCSMSRCVEAALDRYPFSEKERALIRREAGEDFSFRGSELLMVHVIFNLIKNALRHIAQAGKGIIAIRVETSPQGNRLIFRDTGAGIEPEVLPHIFKRFYTSGDASNSVLGAGIGLAFCRDVMHLFGGTIECKSAHGEFTEFVLSFSQP